MNPCTDPQPMVDPAGEERWNNQHLKFIAQSQEGDAEVIFFGDSLIQYLQLTSVWAKWFLPMHSLNFGIGGESTQNVLWRVQNGELDHCKPKAIVLLVGTNNHGCSAEQIAEGILAIARTIREKQKDAYIVILSLLPRGKITTPIRDRNSKVNEIVKNESVQIDKCQYLDVSNGIVQPNGSISHHDMFDYLHLTAVGYEIVFEPVYELLTQLLSENEPEPDLDSILANN